MQIYFKDCKNSEQLKTEYKKLARQLHPDNNPDRDTTKDFQKMQADFETAFKKVGHIHTNAKGETYTTENETDNNPYDYIAIINAIITLENISIEICGSWVWVTGDTRLHKDILKQQGFKWSRNKSAWYFHPENYRKYSKKSYSLDDIRTMYGSNKVDNTPKGYKQIEN